MKVADFDFDLPPALIAQAPARPRDAARLLTVAAALEDRTVGELPTLVQPGDVLVFNNTRVIPARLVGHRGAARIEATLLKRRDDGAWETLAKPTRRLKTPCRAFHDGTSIATGMTRLARSSSSMWCSGCRTSIAPSHSI